MHRSELKDVLASVGCDSIASYVELATADYFGLEPEAQKGLGKKKWKSFEGADGDAIREVFSQIATDLDIPIDDAELARLAKKMVTVDDFAKHIDGLIT